MFLQLELEQGTKGTAGVACAAKAVIGPWASLSGSWCIAMFASVPG